MNTPKINGAIKLTNDEYLNMYELDVQHRNGTSSKYSVASRATSVKDLAAFSGKVKSDAVVVFGMHEDKIVLVKQYRYPIGDYIYELPAGLVDEGESLIEAAKREMKEETGLDFIPNSMFLGSKPWLSSPGMTDEACKLIVGTCTGEPTNENQEESEDIYVVLADKQEAIRILNEEHIEKITAFAIITAFDLLKN